MTSARIVLAFAMLAALSLHGFAMGRHNLPHLLWSCHVASVVLALGLLSNSRLLLSAGFLFHLAIGFPAWLVEVILTRGTFGAPMVTPRVLATSISVHLLPLIAGVIYLQRSPLPGGSVLVAWLFQVAMVPLSRWFTPPELNVNLAHAVWKPLSGTFTSMLVFQLALSLLALASLVVARAVWNNAMAKLFLSRRD